MADENEQANVIDEARLATELHPTNASHFNHLGCLLMQSGRVEEGKAALLRAADLQPNDPAHPRELAFWLGNTGHLAEAVRHMVRAVELNPNIAENNAILAHHLARVGDFQTAEGYLRRATELEPGKEQYRQDLKRNLEIQAQLNAERQSSGTGPGAAPRANQDEKVLVGQDGWLFLDNDSNQTIAQYQGRLLFTHDRLEQWREELIWRRAFFTALSIPYCLMVAPNKEAVHGDALPSGIHPGAVQPIDQFLAMARPILPVSYARDRLRAARSRWTLFDKVDTHWSVLGALIACEHLNQVYRDAYHAGIADFDITRHPFIKYPSTGDLGAKFTPNVSAERVRLDPAAESGHLVSDNGIVNHGNVQTFLNERGNGRKCLIFGDSFGINLARVLKEYFTQTVFCHASLIDAAMVEAEQPDIVISEHVERFLITPPGRSANFDNNEVIRQKRRAA